MRRRAPDPRPLALLAACALALATAGCAYFNTFYSARKNFEAAEKQMEASADPEARAPAGTATLYDKAIQGATQVVVEYPKSKWVDDAMLLIGRAELGKGDYEDALGKFVELGTNFPRSDLLGDATFYSGVAYERDRRRKEAIALFDSLTATYPKSKHVDEARFRRARLYVTLKEPQKALPDLEELSKRKGKLGYDAALQLAEALFAQQRYEQARAEFGRVAERAPTDALRLEARLRAGDCDEAQSDYARAAESYLRLLRDSRTPDAKARARLRYGSALALAGEVDKGLSELANVVQDFPRTAYAAEAMFRTGYLQEVVRDDFAAAQEAYDRVGEQQPGSPFVAQARIRRDNLARLAQMRAEASDTTAADRAAQAAFEGAELYLFQLAKPERALAEYDSVIALYPGTDYAPKAALARGWVLARRLGDPAGARKAWQQVIDRWPDSEYATAARAAMADPADSTYRLEALPPTALQFPLVPGNPLYVPPPPLPTPRPGARPRPGTPGAAADSAAARPPEPAAPLDSLAAARTTARLDSLRARADSIRAAFAARRDSARKMER